MSSVTGSMPPRRIALFGAGSRGRQCLASLRDDARFVIECFFDNDPAKWNTELEGVPIKQPTAAACNALDAIVLASIYAQQILIQLAGLECASRVAFSPVDLIRRHSTGKPIATPEDVDDPEDVPRLHQRLLSQVPPHVTTLADRLDRDPPPVPPRGAAWSDETACTICCNNYLAHALVLGRSFLRQHPGGRFFIGLADRHAPDVPYPTDPRIHVVSVDTIGIPDFEAFAFKYDVLEFNTAIKPYLLEYLFRREGVRRLLYLDPDILVLDSLAPLFERLARTPLVLTPHLTRPYTDDRQPGEVDIMRAGTFNLGFIGLAAHEQTWTFLTWWQQRLYHGCAREPEKGLFTDQKWIDLVPSFFPEYDVVRDPDYNVAYWNLHERDITCEDRFLSNGRSLRFFHFSGMDVQDLDAISKYQNRHTLPNTGPLRDLFELYRLLLLRHGHASAKAIPYTYARFDNGVRVPAILRTLFRQARLSSAFPRPFQASDPHGLFAWLRAPSRPGLPITNLLATLHAHVPELRAAYPDLYGTHITTFLRYMRSSSKLYELPPELIGLDVKDLDQQRDHPSVLPAIAGHAGSRTVVPKRLRGVNVIGYLRSETGMGEGGRTLIRALQAKRYPVAHTVIQARDGARQRDDSMRGVPSGAPYPVSVFFANADQVDVIHAELGPAFFTGRYNIGVWLWELDTLPAWLRRFDFYDEIWTNSRFVQEAVAVGSPVPVINIRMPIAAPPAPAESMRQTLGLPDDRVVLLFAFDSLSIIERKNPLAVVEAFRRAFGSRSREAFLAIKASRLEQFPAEHRALTEAIRDVGGRLFDTYFDRAMLNGLFHACDAYVSLHRSEGFGLTMAEAMAIGKPVVATGYSGNMDFMTSANSYLVRYRLTPLTRDFGPYPKGAHWADPDLDHAAELMRAIVDRPDEARARGARAAADLARTHSTSVVGDILTARLNAISERRSTDCPV